MRKVFLISLVFLLLSPATFIYGQSGRVVFYPTLSDQVTSSQMGLNYSYIDSIYGNIVFSGNTASISSSVHVSMDGLSAQNITELQQLTNGTWKTIATWSSKDKIIAQVSKDYPVPRGYSYRLRVNASAINNSMIVIESDNFYSSIKTCN